jgi:hypothetical protein
MTEATIRTAIYNAVNGVANAGLVYDRERHATTWTDFLALFKTRIGSVSQVRGWMVGYRGISEAESTRFGKGDHRITRTHRFQVMGIMGIDDSEGSEKTFAAIAEDVCDALDSDATLHAFHYVSPATLGYDPSPFAGVLVHAAVITLEVTEAA